MKQFLVGNGIGAPEGLLVRPGVGEVKSGSATTLTVDGFRATSTINSRKCFDGGRSG